MSDEAAPTDAALMSRVKTGDRDAFSELVNRYKDPLVGYLTRMTRSGERAEDLAQEAFVRLFEHARRYEERGQLGPYLFRIATNVLRTEERRNRRRRWLDLLHGPNGAHQHVETPQTRLLREEASERVAWALSRLPLRYRSPLVLREIEGWSYARIAVALGCRVGTVKSRINRGREQLRRLLAPYWNGDAS